MSKLQNDIEFLGLNYKKEMIKILLISIGLVAVSVICFIFVSQIYISIMMAVGSVFVIYMEMGAVGAAWGTVISQGVSFILSVVFLWRHQRHFYAEAPVLYR